MWALAIAIFLGCKWLTWWYASVPRTPLWKHAAYLAAWPGLDAYAFLGRHPLPASLRPAPREWLLAGCRTAIGLALVYVVARRVPAENTYLAGWVGMVGLIMTLHFGSFHLLSCAWRGIGVDALPLMNRPLVSVSLSDFWGRRWNTAFRDLTHRFLFRPLTSRLGPRRALLVGFLLSGLVHEAVISLPAGGGYGGPTLFFLLQPVGMLIERSRIGESCGLRSGWRGWLFTMGALLLPLAMLFHKPFVTEVVLPFLRAIGAI
jgi:alginate O-acetyltransferase complex protein AlgI